MMARAEDFIRDHTQLSRSGFVPELTLWLASEVTPLWQATEAWLVEHNCAPPYWAFAWAGGQALARYSLDHPERVAGRRVFELASGCGIGAIAAAKAGAACVTANEIDPLALAAIRLNAEANGVAIETVAGDRCGQPLTDCNLVLAGDICYEQAMAARLLPWLRGLATGGTEVWLADPGRAYLPQVGLQPLASYTIPVTRDLEGVTARTTTLYKLIA